MRFILIFLFLISCQGDDGTTPFSSQAKQVKGEYVHRKSEDITEIPLQEAVPLPNYAWDKKGRGKWPKITKEYFRCKGSSLNPIRTETMRGEVVKISDCGGGQKHSLPLKNQQEFIYPILLELLNHVQDKTGKRVVITSGHRCPEHNNYVDPAIANQCSKHQIGAEVDFYVQGMENKPQEVVQILIDYYANKGKEFVFKRYEKKEVNTITPPWMNQEIFVKLYTAKEGRNVDNRHPYPYIGIQVRYDSDTKEKVVYSWDQAFRNYLRY